MKQPKAKKSEDPMIEMRERYELCVDADREQRDLARDDWEFVTVRGAQWDERQRRARKGRPCYEVPILRAHVRQVVNDQKKARPAIKVRPVENGDAKGAELRQGLIRNIEQTSNADRAYDNAFETLVASGFGAWLVSTRYSSDDAWDQDLCIERIDDPLNSVWLDPDDDEDPEFGFVERTYTRSAFKRKYPKADPVSFESARGGLEAWFGEDSVRVVAYYRKVPHEKEIALLSDGRSVDMSEVKGTLDELAQQGITVVKARKCQGHKVVVSICSGAEEIDGPYETVFHRIPIVAIWANRHKMDGEWRWCGMVRHSRDPQQLLNYNLTTAQEAVAKTPKSPYLVTPKMLAGEGVKEAWQRANVEDPFALPYTPDPEAPGGRPIREAPADVPAAFLALTSTFVDMLKASDGIYDASVGARSNETSGRAIMARQAEGDTATYDYQDALTKGIQITGDLLLRALHKVYDTPRVMRVIGKDGSEKLEPLYQEVVDQQTGRMVKINDLSAGKYDVTVTTAPSYDTQRMEFVDAMTQLSQGNPLVAQATADLVMKAYDFPGADEAAERLKLLLPPPIQQQMAQGKDMPPEVMQAMQQAQQMMEQAQQQMAMIQQGAVQLEQEKAATDAEKQQIEADKKLLEANFKRMQAELKAATLEAQSNAAMQANDLQMREESVEEGEEKVEEESQALMIAQGLIEQASILLQQQAAMMEQMGQMVAMATKPKPAMQIVRDENGRVTGAVPVEVADGA